MVQDCLLKGLVHQCSGSWACDGQTSNRNTYLKGSLSLSVQIRCRCGVCKNITWVLQLILCVDSTRGGTQQGNSQLSTVF